jgi:methyl-accepting chemotaxis protein
VHVAFGMSLSLKGKFRVMVGIAAAGLLVLAGCGLSSLRSEMLAQRMEKTKNLVELPYSIVVEQHRLEAEGKISREEAQRRALEAIRAMRYDGSDYFWINDMHPTMVMHPVKPELNGNDLSNFKDPTGKTIFVEFVNAARTANGGFVSYMWPKPGSDQPVQKVSFVKGFEPWGWVIGTGVYVEDIDTAWRKEARLAAFLWLSFLVVLLIVSTRVYRSTFVRFQEMIECIKDVAEGERNLTKRVTITCQDEVADLGTWFNRFIDKVLVAGVQQHSESGHGQ